MEFFKSGKTNFSFVDQGKRRLFGALSSLLVLASIVLFAIKQMNGTVNWGIDFAGGTVIDVEFDKEVPIEKLRALVNSLGYKKSSIQRSHSSVEAKPAYIVRVERIAILSAEEAKKLEEVLRKIWGEKLRSLEFDADSGDQFDLRFADNISQSDIAAGISQAASEMQKPELAKVNIKPQGREEEHRFLVLMVGVAGQLESALQKEYADSHPAIRKVEFVGPQVGEKLRNDGILAMIYAILGILAYVAFRFNLQFAPGAVIALAHDALLTIGFFVLLGREIDLTFVAAVLTVIGYSVNDTIVIYDRIRENMARIRNQPLEQVINTSLNEVLNRTIITSATTVLSLVGLLIIGFGEIFNFALAMTFGIVVGTYSSIYIASSLTILLDKLWKKAQA